MSTSQQLASAVEALTQVKTAFDAQKASIQSKFTEYQSLLSSAVAAVPNMTKLLYIDSANGSDDNPGDNIGEPLLSLDKALEIAESNIGGFTNIQLAPGVYDWTKTHYFTNKYLYVSGQENMAEETIIRLAANKYGAKAFSCLCEFNNLQIIRTGDNGHENVAVVVLHGGAISLGSWRSTSTSGSTTPTNYTFKYSSEISPVVKSERGGGFLWIENSYIQGTGENNLIIDNTRSQLITSVSDVVTSNAIFRKTNFKNITVGE